MISIKKSPTADTRTCDFSKVDQPTLLKSSVTHIGDVTKALAFFVDMLQCAAVMHDWTKIQQIEWFHRDFRTGFKENSWWNNHIKQERHHLGDAKGVPKNVNLLDVLEYIADCVMAGKARSGNVHEIVIEDAVLRKAFRNTCDILINEVEVDP